MNDLSLRCLPAIQPEAHAGFNLVKPLPSCRARIEIQHPSQYTHPLDPKNMAVPADEQIRRVGFEFGTDACSPPLRMPTDMRHPYPNTPHRKSLVLRYTMAHFCAIHIAPNRSNWSNQFQLIQYFCRTDIPGMQDKIYPCQDIRQFGMEIAVGI